MCYRERIAGYWISFAESKDPNHAEAPAWPGFTAAAPIRQILNTPITHLSDLDANCGFSDSVGYNVDSLSRVRGEFGG